MTTTTANTTTTPTTLADAGTGDTLVRVGRRTTTIATVTAHSAAYLWVGHEKFRRHDGQGIGSAKQSTLRVGQVGEVERLVAEREERQARQAAELEASRNALRGRTLGHVTAAEEAVRQKAFAASQDGGSSHPLLDTVNSMLWHAADDLRTAERDVHEAAATLRRYADQIEHYVDRDINSSGGAYHQVLVEVAGVDRRRADAVNQCQHAIRLAAAVLGVTVEELIAPMAAPAAVDAT